MQSELKLRILSGIVLAVVVLAATWFGGIAFRILSAAIALLVYVIIAIVGTAVIINQAWIAFVAAGILYVWAVVLFGMMIWRSVHGEEVDLKKEIWKPTIMLVVGVIVFWVGVYMVTTLIMGWAGYFAG